MKAEDLLGKIFSVKPEMCIEGSIISGIGRVDNTEVCFFGTTEAVFIGLDEILALSEKMLGIIREHPGKPILMLVNNNGQRMALREELLALPEYIAHLISTQMYAIHHGHKLLSLVYGNSIAGGFIAFGMAGPGRIYATSDANTSVMNLPAISKVTKLPLEKLEELSKTIPVFAPGRDNFFKMGGLHEIVSTDSDLSEWLVKALEDYKDEDNRAELGEERGGRRLAGRVIQKVLDA